MKLRLRYLREYHGLTQKEVANAIGIGYSTYCMFENESLSIPTYRIIQLSNFYKINIDYLIKLTDKMINVSKNEKVNKSKIAQRLKSIRLELNLTLREYAKTLSISHTTYYSYEIGKSLISLSTLLKICKTFEISADFILGKSNIKYLKDLY